jgi:branched-chain amino acid transport system permease protein
VQTPSFLTGSEWKRPAIIAGALSALVLLLFVLSTPSGVVVMGGVEGLMAAFITVGIVLVYRTTRIVNFAAGAIGAVGAMFAASLIVILGWPYLLAFVIALIVATGAGIVSELLLRRFFDAPRLIVTMATIGLLGLVLLFAQTLPSLPIWGDPTVTATRLINPQLHPLPWLKFHISPFDFELGHILAIILGPVLFGGVGWFLLRTRTGTAIRASSENAERAEMLGINVKMLSMIVWAVAGGLAGAAITLQATTSSFAVGGLAGPEAMMLPLAAAVLASMRSLPMAVLATIALTITHRAIQWEYIDTYKSIMAVLLLALIVVGPLLMRRLRSREREASSWASNEETRPVPQQLASIGEIRTWRRVIIGTVLIALLLFPWITSIGPTNSASLAAIVGVVLLSINVLSGWTGQISLGHWGLVAVGALVGGGLIDHAGLSFWLALPAGALVTGLVAGLLGLPALRIRGLLLAVSTFAFSFVAWLVLFNESWFSWLIPTRVDRPTLLLLDFEDERSMYYLALAFLALSFGFVTLLRRGRPGRVLIGLRENEDDLMAMGINPVFTRLSGFMLSGFMAGLAGVMFAVHQRAVTATSFEPTESLNIFMWAIIGGLGAPLGAVLGTVVRALTEIAPSDPALQFIFNPSFGVLLVLYVAPRGLAGLVQSARDSVLRIVAQRRGIAAPSLFADMEAAAIEKRLVLLGDRIEGRGLDTLGSKRYRLSSEVHAVERRSSKESEEKQALSAAADALLERAQSGNGSLAPAKVGD